VPAFPVNRITTLATVETTHDRTLGAEGFALLPAFANAVEVAALQMTVAARFEAPHEGGCERPHNTLLPLRWNDVMVARLLRDDARVAEIRQVTSATDLRWISGYISSKEPHTPPLWWHQDWWCWNHPVSFRNAAPQIALLLYLTDTSEVNGALRILPGTHLHSAPIHALLPEAHSSDAERLDPAHPAFTELPGQKTFSLRAGDAIVLDYRVLHGTHANRSAMRRDALLLTFAPSWCSLPGDVRGHLIDHPALPSNDETPLPSDLLEARLLPSFDGQRRTLRLNRNAPSEFAVGAYQQHRPATTSTHLRTTSVTPATSSTSPTTR
jgi:Phytanoyl-CoA dioxygenase (PhyH)